MLIDAHSGRSAILEQALSDAGPHRHPHRQYDRLLQQVQDIKPDVILIDTDLPDRDTLEQLARCRRNQPKPIVMFAERSDLKPPLPLYEPGLAPTWLTILTPSPQTHHGCRHRPVP